MNISNTHIILVALGGSLGAVLRYICYYVGSTQLQQPLYVSTFFINLLGSFCIGMAFILLPVFFPQTNMAWRAFLIIGLLGGFTTFSAFSLEVVNLLEKSEMTTAFLYIFGSVSLCALGCYLGLQTAKLLMS